MNQQLTLNLSAPHRSPYQVILDLTPVSQWTLLYPPLWLKDLFLEKPEAHYIVTQLSVPLIIETFFAFRHDTPSDDILIWEVLETQFPNLQAMLEDDYNITACVECMEAAFQMIVQVTDEIIRNAVLSSPFPDSVKQDYGGFILKQWLTPNSSLTSPMLHGVFVYEQES